MKRLIEKTAIALLFGIGLTLLLLWILDEATPPAAHATASTPDVAAKVERSPLQAGDVLTVCPALAGTCPYTNVQAAVDAAHDGDVIKVATGIYTGTNMRPASSGYDGPSVVTQAV